MRRRTHILEQEHRALAFCLLFPCLGNLSKYKWRRGHARQSGDEQIGDDFAKLAHVGQLGSVGTSENDLSLFDGSFVEPARIEACDTVDVRPLFTCASAWRGIPGAM